MFCMSCLVLTSHAFGTSHPRQGVPAPDQRVPQCAPGVCCLHKALLFCLQGKTPPTDTALELYSILSESDTNLRQPVALEMQLMQDQHMDSDVGKSMLQLLQVCLPACFACSELPCPVLP